MGLNTGRLDDATVRQYATGIRTGDFLTTNWYRAAMQSEKDRGSDYWMAQQYYQVRDFMQAEQAAADAASQAQVQAVEAETQAIKTAAMPAPNTAAIQGGAPDAPTAADAGSPSITGAAAAQTRIADDGDPRRRYGQKPGIAIGGTQGGVGIRL